MEPRNTANAVFGQPQLRLDALPRLRLNPAMNMGARIFAERKNKGLTQQELAKRCGRPLTQTTINSMETRDSKASKHAGVIAEALGVRIEWLLLGEEPKYRASDPDREALAASERNLIGAGADSPPNAEQPHPLVSKLAAAIRAGHLSATAIDMLEAALDSQLVKAVKTAGSNVAVPPPSVLLELRTAQLDADAGTATPESISAMNRRIRSRSNAERSRTRSSVMGGTHRRDKTDR